MDTLQSLLGNHKTNQKTPNFYQPATGVFSIEDKPIEDKVIEKKERTGMFKKDYQAYVALARQRYTKPLRAVDNTKYMFNGVLTLPEQIVNLVDNPRYLPKYNKLAQEWGIDYLLKLAELATTGARKAPASHWFNTCTSLRVDPISGSIRRVQTLKMLDNLFERIAKAKQMLKEVGAKADYLFWAVKGVAKLSDKENQNLMSDIQRKRVKDPLALFIWTLNQRLKPPNTLTNKTIDISAYV